MARINLETTNCKAATKALNESKEVFGGISNFQKILSNSPNALSGVSRLFQEMYSGTLAPEIRTKVALAVSQSNSCQYCVAAHTDSGLKIGLNDQEINSAKNGKDKNFKTEQAIKFALAILEHQGELTDDEVSAVKDAGFSEAEIVELIVLVGLFSLGNYVGKVSQIDLDIPQVKELNTVS